MKKFNTEEIEAILGYTFNNKSLLKQAFTRRSYVEENPAEKDNEVLEFIGDSVFGMIVVKKLAERYTKTTYKTEEERNAFATSLINAGFPLKVENYLSSELSESELSEMKISLVNKFSLAKATESLGLEQYLIMGKGDQLLNIQNEKSVKEDLFEAIIGAVTIDCGWNMTKIEAVIERTFDIDGRIENEVEEEPNYKALVEKWLSDHCYCSEFENCHVSGDNLPHAFSIRIGTSLVSETFYGYGKTESGALRMTAKRAWEYIESLSARAEKIEKAIGEADENRAINQLQELWQKGIINKPEYTCEQSGVLESGNPGWSCFCRIEGAIDSIGGWVMESKSEAKKSAAYEAMLWLTNKYR